MKITKTSIGVLFVTFLIGHASVPPLATKQIVPEQIPGHVSTVSTAIEKPFSVDGELETVEENDNHDYGGNYPFKIKLLETGDGFHGDEVPAKDGETWLGLFNENGRHFLRPTKVKIRRVYDPIVDDEEKHPKRKTGKSVEVNDKANPVFLLKNSEKLRAGEVATLFRGVTFEEIVEYSDEMTSLKKGFFHEYEIGGKKYTLRVKEAKTEEGERVLALMLEGEGKRQILHTTNVNEYSEELGALFWVGDLDRDGKPDFYMELYVHENVSHKNLFFSAPAAKDKLVKKVAYFWTTGC
ncbi:MAG TPA: hypothetical protein VK400_11590 [Pyrinomonadaceae bacterium]|nr:hypothetical protein [Pyrinomonadaceae bacterium]